MAISVDTVYQKVLALANKEQRGYITPQEFNLLANQAQMEIFEQYFYDQNQTDRNLKNSTEFSNVDEMLDEKISVFKKSSALAVASGIADLPIDLYRLGMVWHTNTRIELEQLTEEEALYLNLSPIAKPTPNFPAYVRTSQTTIQSYPTMTVIRCNYIRRDFEIHNSDEAELVYKILSLAGIVIAKPGLGTYADGQIMAQKQQEKQ